MKGKKHIIFMVCSLALIAVFLLPAARAETKYPTRPVQLVCPYPAGGSLDMHMRALVAVAGQYLGQPMIPVIRSGAAGTVGAASVARSTPNGYTLFIGATAPLTVKPLVEKLPYTPEDFIPLGQLSASPMIASVLTSQPWKTLKEFINAAKKSPGKYKYATAGVYEPEHISIEALSQMTGMKLIHVPMGGGGPAMATMLGGHVDLGAYFPPVISQHILAGKVRPLAVTSAQRLKHKDLKDIPTLKELGYDHTNYMWVALFAPKGTPQPIVQKLRTVVKQVCEDKSFKKLMSRMGQEITYMSGEDFGKYWKEEQSSIGSLIKIIK